MKNSYRFIGSSMLIAALFVSQLVGISSAFAAGYLTLSSFSGYPAQTITVSGGGLVASSTLKIYLGSVSGNPVTAVSTTQTGDFSASVKIPANAPEGALTIIGVDSENNQLSNSYYVVPLAGSISYTAPSHAPFGTVTIDGSGFAPNESVTLSLSSNSTQITTNASGSFTGATLTVPFVASGLYTVNALGQTSGASSLQYFWIDAFYPSTSPSDYYLLPGQALSFTGSGFAPNETISVTELNNSTVLSTFTADATGNFNAAGSFSIPTTFHGSTRTFALTGSQSHSVATTGMTIGDFYAYASPSAYWLLPGATLSFSGGGFAAGETVEVYKGTDTVPATTFTTNTVGNFEKAGSVTIPFNAAGGTVSYKLIGTGSHAETSVLLGVGSFYPSISPSDYYVQANSVITISGSGFAPGESVALSVNGGSSTQTTADTFGTISAPVTIPFAQGFSTVSATGAESHATATVDVTMATFYSSVTPSAYYVFPGDSLTLSGTGFAPNETITISPKGDPAITLTANAQGGFTSSPINVPLNASMGITFQITGELSQSSVVLPITVGILSPYLASDAYSATPGQTVHLSGSSFAAGEIVTITAGSFTTTTTADMTGMTPAVAVPVPYNSGSSLHVVFTGNSSNATASLDISLGNFYPSVSANNYYVAPGTTITVNGSGFAPNETIALTAGTFSGSATTNISGTFSAQVTIPFENLTSTVTVTAIGNTSGATGTVGISLAPFSTSVQPDTYYTSRGSSVTFTGSGFAANETISATFNGSALPSFTANAEGSFTQALTIPLSAQSASFVFTGGTTHSVSTIEIGLAQFYSGITLSTYYAQGGSALVVSGTGFGANESVSVAMGASSIGTATADASGTFTLSGSVPFSPAGEKTITATGVTSGATASSPITIAPVYSGVSLAQYASAPGTSITFIGTGYLPNESITITTDRSPATATFTADASGNFSNSSFIIPVDTLEGNLVLTITGNNSFSSNSITYYVTGM